MVAHGFYVDGDGDGLHPSRKLEVKMEIISDAYSHIHMFEDASVDCDMVLVAKTGDGKGLLKTSPHPSLVSMF